MGGRSALAPSGLEAAQGVGAHPGRCVAAALSGGEACRGARLRASGWSHLVSGHPRGGGGPGPRARFGRWIGPAFSSLGAASGPPASPGGGGGRERVLSSTLDYNPIS